MASDVDVEPCKREMPKLAVVIEEDAEHGEQCEENIARGNMEKIFWEWNMKDSEKEKVKRRGER